MKILDNNDDHHHHLDRSTRSSTRQRHRLLRRRNSVYVMTFFIMVMCYDLYSGLYYSVGNIELTYIKMNHHEHDDATTDDPTVTIDGERMKADDRSTDRTSTTSDTIIPPILLPPTQTPPPTGIMPTPPPPTTPPPTLPPTTTPPASTTNTTTSRSIATKNQTKRISLTSPSSSAVALPQANTTKKPNNTKVYDNNDKKKSNWRPFIEIETIKDTTNDTNSIWNDFYINTIDVPKGRMLCHRKCSKNNNKNPNYIIYGKRHDLDAGLADRSYILHHLTELAAYLCALDNNNNDNNLSSSSPKNTNTNTNTGGGVWFGTPADRLSYYHNNYTEIDQSLTWKDFFTTSYQYSKKNNDDNHHQNFVQEMIYTKEYDRTRPIVINNKNYIIIQPRRRQVGKTTTYVKPSPIKLDRNQYRLFHTTNPSQVINHFLQIQNMSFGYPIYDTTDNTKQKQQQKNQTNFVWYIDTYYYEITEQLQGWIRNQSIPMISNSNHPNNNNDDNEVHVHHQNQNSNNYIHQPLLLPLQDKPYCKYTESGTSTKIMSKLVTDFTKTTLLPQIQKHTMMNSDDNEIIDIDSLLIGSWHIRRKDSITVCDTSLERMQKYYDCTFHPSRVNQILQITEKRYLVVLLYSDEVSYEYRSSIQEMFHHPTNNTNTNNKDGLVKALWLDDLVTDFFEEQVQNGTIPLSYKNNYHVFGLLHELQRSIASSFHLEHRWQIVCPDCVDLTTHIHK